ncbi:protein phosphatase 2C domain-containing protein [Calothrix sp. UHCC 0171]|uniref:protein phosphatase 2C domain-containing protein n=1 Tax=Calothrix sp. UHCC 0171 TaxID=3110245 RepID=UPI002B201A67|nr:protein phosphatase 2C domain-containing protein [Calothrix sp. UHCC 0171]MEA5570584.1 protein phosphatase 2C domain-containing protein [Calothrix sp. UHCC 0171]
MEKDAAMLNCPNEACQTANPLNHHFCQQCRTPLPKRYLWAVAEGKNLGVAGNILADRYLIISQSVLFDTRPGLVPVVPEMEKLQKLKSYLRLFPYRLHVPQVYGVIPAGEENQQEILLLEKPPLRTNVESVTEVQLYKSIDVVWGEATSMRQLNWLWQIANLWQPLASEGVASSLLEASLIRPEGSVVKLLELRHDGEKKLSLADLGEFWRSHLLQKTKNAIAEFLAQVCDSLINGEIRSGEQLVAILDQGLIEVGRAENSSAAIFNSSVKIVTRTDTGPSRQRNEDACYPVSGSKVSKPPQPTALAIVCDGIGGHEGGNVASNIAIEVIQQQVNLLAREARDRIDPTILLADLEQAVAVANEKISQRNDTEGRQGRQRMGTTLVMALPIAHEMYITHVGDSRAYLITRQGCYQVTLDDDVASREVRLGYAVYRDAINQGASGSLVQALGMGSSNSLHPSAQRFVLDEDCVFLLCSDGLSDFDRVEQYWESEILPILNNDFTDGVDMSIVADRLIDIANTQNGHDNVTIALVHYQIKYTEPESIMTPKISDLYLSNTSDLPTKETPSSQFNSSRVRTQVMPDTEPAKNQKFPLYLIAVPIFLVLAGAMGYILSQSQNSLFKIPLPTQPVVTPTNLPNPPILSNAEKQTQVGSLISVKEAIAFSQTPSPFTESGLIPSGTILKILNTSAEIPEDTNQSDSLQVLVCSVNSQILGPSPVEAIKLRPKDKIWIQASQIKASGSSVSKPAAGVNPCGDATEDDSPAVDTSPPTPSNTLPPRRSSNPPSRNN